MTYEYKRKRRFHGFGFDRTLARAVVPIPIESTPIVRETVVAPTRSEYEVSPLMIRPTPETIETAQPAIQTLVTPTLVRQDPMIFPDPGWAPVPPPNPNPNFIPYVESGPAPIVVEPLRVEPLDSVALTSRAVTSYPLDSQMSAADASLQQALITRGLPAQEQEVADRPASAYTAPVTDSRFTDPYRDPMSFVDMPTRPDMEPDYTMLPRAPVEPAPARTSYVKDDGLTDLHDRGSVDLPPQPPTEGSIAPRTDPTMCAEGFVANVRGLCDPAPSPDRRKFGTCAEGFFWNVSENACRAVPARSTDSIDVDEVVDPIVAEDDTFSQELSTEPPLVPEEGQLPSEAYAAMMAQECNEKGGFYVYDPASGQNICQTSPSPSELVAPPTSETPWLLIGAGLLAAWFLLKE